MLWFLVGLWVRWCARDLVTMQKHGLLKHHDLEETSRRASVIGGRREVSNGLGDWFVVKGGETQELVAKPANAK